MHVHPQWQIAEYHDGRWKLTSDWSILNYSREEARHMLQRGKDYLENLLKEIDPNYRCVSFRSGAWCIAPSPHMLDLLVELGIVFDMKQYLFSLDKIFGGSSRLWIPVRLAQYIGAEHQSTIRVLENIREPIVLPVPAITGSHTS